MVESGRRTPSYILDQGEPCRWWRDQKGCVYPKAEAAYYRGCGGIVNINLCAAKNPEVARLYMIEIQSQQTLPPGTGRRGRLRLVRGVNDNPSPEPPDRPTAA